MAKTAKGRGPEGGRSPVRKGHRPVSAIEEPGYEGRRQLVEEYVENPYRPGTYERATRNARHDPIEQLFAQRDRRGRPLISRIERDAATRVRGLVETLGLDAVRAIVTEPRVANSTKWKDLPAHLIDAGREMTRLRAELGPDMTTVLVRVAGYGETVTLVAADYEDDETAWSGTASFGNGVRQGTSRAIGWMLRLALRRAVDHFYGGTATGATSRGVVAWRDTGEIVAETGGNAASGRRRRIAGG